MTGEKTGLSAARGAPFDSLDRYWAFVEGQGDVVHEHTSAADHGTVTDGTWTTGDFSRALEFNGTSTEVNVSGPPAYGQGPFTLVCWAEHYSPNDGDADVLLHFHTNNWMQLRDTGNGDVFFTIRDTANNTNVSITTGKVVANMPTMWVVRSDGSTMELLMARADGSGITQEDSASVPSTGADGDKAALGYRADVGDKYLDGIIEGTMTFGAYLSDAMLWRLLQWRSRQSVGPYLPIGGGKMQGRVNLDAAIASQTSDSMTANPESDTEDGYVEIKIDGTTYQVPVYTP